MERKRSLRPLFVEDSDDDAFLLLRELRRGGFEIDPVVRVDSREGLLAAIEEGPYDLVISDYAMPGFTGVEALGLVRARHPHMPFLMVSGTIGEETAVEALRAGADDFLVKGRLARLLPAIDRVLRDAREREERRAAQAEVERARSEQLRAEAASRAKSDFLANVSHELRTPLNAIIGFSELLDQGLDGELGERQKEHVRNVLQSGKHLLSIINDVLDVSKIEAGRMTLSPEPTSVEAVAARVRASLMPILEERDLSIVLALPEDLPILWADPLRLRQILYNLLSNACKFTPAGGSIRVSATMVDETVAIAVRDTGVGIRAEDLPRLFHEFEQLDPTGRSGLEGTGLGLVLTRRLVELHGGTIGVESEYGRGATFTVRLPLPDVPLQLAPLSERPSPLSTARPSRSAFIVVVEDDPPSRSLTQILLERRGHEVITATTVDEARAAMRRRRPDLVLTDLQVAGGGGEQLLREIRSDTTLTDLPVVTVTANAMHGVRERLLAAGFDGYLSKPIDTRAFGPAIESYLPPRP